MLDRARVGFGVSGQDIEQGRLTGAVSPDQPDLLPGLNRERGAGEDPQVSTVVLDEISCDNHLHDDEISILEKLTTSPLRSNEPSLARCAIMPIILYTR